jgi:LmbE family N-acetylglucosaminyl deacetylase
MKSLVLFVASFITLQTLSSQTSPELTSSEILLGLEKLNTLGSVLYIAAHPDDENTRLLAYFSKEKKLRTGYLSLTRGDGGQNLIGKEQGDALGLIRTQELLAARRIDGAEQFFTRANDFGYSKNPEETFSHWNKDSILADVVWTIRKFKPDIIICRFPTTGEGGHGHHTASAILALEAFDAAADPKRFPYQLVYVDVWQARRIFWNTFNFGGINTTGPNQLKLDAGVYNPLLGKSYGEIAAESRSNHKSQGFGTAKTRGSAIEFFKLLKGDTARTGLFEGIDQTWKRCSVAPGMYNHSLDQVPKLIEECIRQFNPDAPATIIPELTEIYKKLLPAATDAKERPELLLKDHNIDSWKIQKLKEVQDLLLACSGLWMEAYTADFTGVPGKPVNITSQIIKRNDCEAKLEKINYLQQTDTITEIALKTNELLTFRHKENLSLTTPFSNPYWLNEKHEEGTFIIKDQLQIGKPENDSRTNVIFYVQLKDVVLEVKRPLEYKSTDPVKGERYRPFEILPPATLNISEKVYVFSGSGPKTIKILLRANENNVTGTLQLSSTGGWEIEIKNPAFKLQDKGDELSIEATLKPGKNGGDGKLMASLDIDGVNYNKSIQRIEYDHIPYQFILSNAEAKLVNINLKKAGTKIAYIPGAGDEIPDCLKEIGYTVTVLTDELLSTETLSRYDAIITGVRAYNTNSRLPIYYSKLMEYIKNGGNLIVQYNTNNNLGQVPAKIGPYPFTISRERVTNENAEVRILQPTHSAFNFPNTIMQSDFEGWVQERGIYFASYIDKNYQPLLSMNDPNEKPNEGSLITAKYGKGNFVYTGLDFFRELPAGVPGAYRLLVNLLSLPQNK